MHLFHALSLDFCFLMRNPGFIRSDDDIKKTYKSDDCLAPRDPRKCPR